VLLSQLFLYWGPNWGVSSIEGMAIGVVAGGMVQAFCQLPTLYKKGYRWYKKTIQDPVWSQDPRLKQMLWMMVPGTVGLAATQVNILVNTILATSQGPGAVSWLNYSFRLMQFPIGIFGVSLASATLPKVSYQWAHKDIHGVSETLTSAIRNVMAINLPASAGLAFLGTGIIELIFQYGRFYYEDTRATALALAMYSIGLTAYSAVKVLVPACYALGNTRVPVISSILAVLVTIVLNLMMVGPFGFWGLALGTSIAAIFNAVFLLFAIRKLIQSKGGQFSIKPIGRGLLEYSFVALLMGGVCWFSQQFLGNYLTDDLFLGILGRPGIPLGRGLKMAFLIAEGVLIVVLTARVLRLKEAVEIINLFANKLKNKLRRSST
jgi:putative peptidoglycan lipid II flippase